jgi:L-lactate dehydrogenase complex protein LldG
VTATSSAASSAAREEILGRIRRALGDGHGGSAAAGAGTAAAATAETAVPRDYRTAHVETGLVDLFAENLEDYRAHVHRASSAKEVAELVAGLLPAQARLVVPEGLPDEWIPEGAEQLRDTPPLEPAALDTTHAVLTTCALSIAETGTIVLDAGPGQGRRVLTLIPDHHICVIRAPEQIHASLPLALPHLDPARPLTWIAGPSATSDIELDRVEGVHGPRRLDVILLGGDVT